MNRFLKKILVFVLVFLLFDRLLYLIILISPKLEIDDRLERLINGEINKEIIVLGSSRGARNIIAGQISDSLGQSSYNLSYPGSDIEFQEFLLRTLLKFNKKPKEVLLTIDVDAPGEFLPNESIKFRFDRLYPLAKYDYINDELIAHGEKTFLSKYLILSRINKKNFDLRKRHYTELDTIIECGSMPIYFPRYNYSFDYDSSVQLYDLKDESEDKVNAFLKLQNLCIENEIKLTLVFTPNFRPFNTNFLKRLNKLVNEKTSIFIYDTTSTIYQDKSFFYDESHLRTNGAVILTNELIDFLKNKKNNSLPEFRQAE